MNVTFTVPPTSEGLRPAGCYRRTLTALDPEQTGGEAVHGTWLHTADTVSAPHGTLVLCVDKTTTGWERHYKSGKLYPVQKATVTVYRAGEDGLDQLWQRHYKQAKSAFGSATRTQLTRLLALHPAPNSDVTVVEHTPCPEGKGACFACRALQPPPPPRPSRSDACAECGQRRGVHERTDSSGIRGTVCHQCDREPSYVLSFA